MDFPDDDSVVDSADLHNRPVVLESGSAGGTPRRRRPRPRTALGLTAAGIVAIGGLVAGSWSIWSAVGTPPPAGTPAPLWFSPPAPVVTTTTTTQPSIVDIPGVSIPDGARPAVSVPRQVGTP